MRKNKKKAIGGSISDLIKMEQLRMKLKEIQNEQNSDSEHKDSNTDSDSDKSDVSISSVACTVGKASFRSCFSGRYSQNNYMEGILKYHELFLIHSYYILDYYIFCLFVYYTHFLFYYLLRSGTHRSGRTLCYSERRSDNRSTLPRSTSKSNPLTYHTISSNGSRNRIKVNRPNAILEDETLQNFRRDLVSGKIAKVLSTEKVEEIEKDGI